MANSPGTGGEMQTPNFFQNPPKGRLRGMAHGSIRIQEGDLPPKVADVETYYAYAMVAVRYLHRNLSYAEMPAPAPMYVEKKRRVILLTASKPVPLEENFCGFFVQEGTFDHTRS
jgi:hypothetical protein